MFFSIFFPLVLIYLSLPSVDAGRGSGQFTIDVAINPIFYPRLQLAGVTALNYVAFCSKKGELEVSNTVPLLPNFAMQSDRCGGESDFISYALNMIIQGKTIECGVFPGTMKNDLNQKLAIVLNVCPGYVFPDLPTPIPPPSTSSLSSTGNFNHPQLAVSGSTIIQPAPVVQGGILPETALFPIKNSPIIPLNGAVQGATYLPPPMAPRIPIKSSPIITGQVPIVGAGKAGYPPIIAPQIPIKGAGVITANGAFQPNGMIQGYPISGAGAYPSPMQPRIPVKGAPIIPANGLLGGISPVQPIVKGGTQIAGAGSYPVPMSPRVPIKGAPIVPLQPTSFLQGVPVSGPAIYSSGMGPLIPTKGAPLIPANGMGPIQPISKGLPVSGPAIYSPGMAPLIPTKGAPLIPANGLGPIQPISKGLPISGPAIYSPGMGPLIPTKGAPIISANGMGPIQPISKGIPISGAMIQGAPINGAGIIGTPPLSGAIISGGIVQGMGIRGSQPILSGAAIISPTLPRPFIQGVPGKGI